MSHRQARAQRIAEPRKNATRHRHQRDRTTAKDPGETARTVDPAATLAACTAGPEGIRHEVHRLAWDAAPQPFAAQRLQEAARALAEQNGFDVAELVATAATAVAEARRAPEFSGRFVHAHMATGKEDVAGAAQALAVISAQVDVGVIAQAIVARAASQGREQHALLRLQAALPGVAPAPVQDGAPEVSPASRPAPAPAAPAAPAAAAAVPAAPRAPDRPKASPVDILASGRLDALRAELRRGLPPSPSPDAATRFAQVLEAYSMRLRAMANVLSVSAAGKAAMYRHVQLSELTGPEFVVRSFIDAVAPFRTRQEHVAAEMDKVVEQAAMIAQVAPRLRNAAPALIQFHGHLERLGARDADTSALARKVGEQEAALAERGAFVAKAVATASTAFLKYFAAKAPGGMLLCAAIDSTLAVLEKGADKAMNGGGLKWSDTGDLAETALDAAAWSLATGMAVSKFQSLYAGQKNVITKDVAGMIQRILGTSVPPAGAVQATVSALESHLLGSVTGAFKTTAKRAAKGDLSAADAVRMLGSEALSRVGDGERFQLTVASGFGRLAGAEAKLNVVDNQPE